MMTVRRQISNALTISLQWKDHQLSSFFQLWKILRIPQSGTRYFNRPRLALPSHPVSNG